MLWRRSFQLTKYKVWFITDPDAPGQLYNLASDPGETTNVYNKHPEIVAELKALLEEAKASGRTVPQR